MISLTTRQRDILKVMLNTDHPIGSFKLAELLHITPRQVNYSMRGVKVWLHQQDQELKSSPGLGFLVPIPPKQAQALFKKINLQSGVQIILSVSQRQQLLTLFLLTQSEPVILSKLEQLIQVSRVTLAKDLDEIDSWLKTQHVTLIRKPHFGIQISGDAHACQQALAKAIWGEAPFSHDPIITISYPDGLNFNLQADAPLLPLVEQVSQMLASLNMRRAIGLVAKSEEQLGGRFTDDAVLHLALVFAILAHRVQHGKHLNIETQQLSWLQTAKIWPVATYVAKQLAREAKAIWRPSDIAGIAMEMLAAPRNEILPGELERNNEFVVLIEALTEVISTSFELSKLKSDRTLQNGLLNNIVPACFRQRFNLWFPVALDKTNLPEEPERENKIARKITEIVHEYTKVQLPQSEINNLVVLLRAAFIRNRTYRFERVIVVCPSGMATAQLLIARLNARFPYLNNLEVISLRDLTPALVGSANLVLTTVPLPQRLLNSTKVIQVHPLLMPEDIETITKFLS